MFVILVYDVGEKRVAKALKTARKYLYWVQNSVLEGEISEANLRKLKDELKKLSDESVDSFIFYSFRTTKYYDREIIGVKKGGQGLFL
ncbi:MULTISPECIES: CRISPR-associated endonuclease Cas2 [Sedimentibacter]|uniref:CRISPR-associated endoribonuclease Cas2 n=1 Tax=Sedimentibacter hydroxybenzoicus DSM 7310 TaxID=1123245 RepID=A0A974BMG8_SEDHY|nr:MULTISPECIES: CRISPR-associated endonuclease Cas2 [Sedimentibacter]NYB76125.1 CRISPR-associated endonuclease Cas2 [Sedimentibacter hydroxybenzoicus DSM 7310]